MANTTHLSDSIYRQWQAAKAETPDALTFIKAGDFYESFGEDAETIARELDLVITRHPLESGTVPNVGTGYWSIYRNAAALEERGHKVAYDHVFVR